MTLTEYVIVTLINFYIGAAAVLFITGDLGKGVKWFMRKLGLVD